jgi:uncharacterized membrane protein HdeD (DUF308 family)
LGRPELLADSRGYAPVWYRTAEVFFGLASVAVGVVVLANPSYGVQGLALLLALSLVFSAFRMIATGTVARRLAVFEALGLVGGGLLSIFIVVSVFLFPGLSLKTVVFLLAVGLTVQGLGRIAHAAGRGPPRWVRGSAFTVGVVSVLIAGVVLVVQGVALFTLVALLSVVVVFNGIEGVVTGLRPNNRRQLTLMKLILFSLFYGLVLINWIDLFATSAPAYHLWLVMTYMAPFGVLIVFQGLKDWQLAVSLGLLVSLTNDVGYYFMGDLLFGFHQNLAPWLAGQLGFHGSQVLFYFQGGAFTMPVTSVLMGVSIYARVAVVSLVLYHWWTSPYRVKPRI